MAMSHGHWTSTPLVKQEHLLNRILAGLSPEDFALIADQLEPCRNERGAILMRTGEVMPLVYFLERGIASVVVQSPEGQSVEAGIIGREGFIHPATVLGVDSITNTVQMQLSDEASRIRRTDLLAAARKSETLRADLLRFAHINHMQTTYTALSNAVHPIDERLARWLLMVHDRSETNDLALTHDFLSIMLAVRRPSVTTALHVLEGNRFIEASRGYITIRDRAGLEEFAGDAYGRPEAEYRRLFGRNV